jgi:hypothetical protein
MKIRNLLAFGAAIATTITIISTAANGALLSPRAAGNQIKTVSGAANDPNFAAAGQLAAPPRTVANQIATASGAPKGIAQAAVCSRNMAASPKAVRACAANGGNTMPCCGGSVAVAR